MLDSILEALVKFEPLLKLCLYAAAGALFWYAATISNNWKNKNMTLGNVPTTEFIDFTMSIAIALYIIKRTNEDYENERILKIVKRAINEEKGS